LKEQLSDRNDFFYAYRRSGVIAPELFRMNTEELSELEKKQLMLKERIRI